MTNITFTQDITNALENLGLIPEISNDINNIEINIEDIRVTLYQIQQELHLQNMLKLSEIGELTVFELREEINKYQESVWDERGI